MGSQRTVRVAVTIITLVLALQAAPVAAATAPTSSYVVALADGADTPSFAASLHGAAAGGRTFHAAFNGFTASLTADQARALEARPGVLAVVPDTTIAFEPIVGSEDQPPQVADTGVRRVGALESETARIDGEDERIDVDIAIVDSGIDADHPDLNVAGGVDCVEDGLGFDDPLGHGTMVAGFAAALDNDIGTVGVAPGARVWAIRIGDAFGQIQLSWALCGLEWVAAHGDLIEVANLSWGGFGSVTGECGVAPDPALRVDIVHAAVCRMVDSGVTVVAAAGNDGADAENQLPAAYPEVIAVSALGDTDGEPGGDGPPFECLPEAGGTDDELAFFSNFGEVIDIAAPGVCLTSTFPDDTYEIASGTSFSSPLVSGAAALIIAEDPDVSPDSVRSILLEEAGPGPIDADPDDFPEGVLDVSDL